MAIRTEHAITVACVAVAICIAALVITFEDRDDSQIPKFTVSGETDLPGNFFISFVYSKNIVMLDGKGEVVWYKHEDAPADGSHTGFWDFKKHDVGGTTYYSYHDQIAGYDKLGIEGYAPGERVILDENFNEVKRIRFEQSDVVESAHPLDGHDFLLIDLNHYIMSGYIRDRVYNIPGFPDGSNVVYSYLQEVSNGTVVWDWRSVDYPELYDLVVTDANPHADDFANEYVEAPDYVHFNAMRLNSDGNLVCSFRHLNTIVCLDRTASDDQILWKLSGNGDEFGLTAEQKTSSQHYVTVDGNVIRAFDNHNSTGETRIVSYTVDMANTDLLSFDSFRVDGRFSSACGAQQLIQDKLFMIGWGRSENDSVCMSVYDFAEDRELLRVSLENPTNFTYRCVYYE